jgi:hypothetical protein
MAYAPIIPISRLSVWLGYIQLKCLLVLQQVSTHAIEPIPLLMKTMVFFVVDSRKNGSSVLVMRIVPRTFTLNPSVQTSRSSLFSLSTLFYRSEQTSHLRQLVGSTVWINTRIVHQDINLVCELADLYCSGLWISDCHGRGRRSILTCTLFISAVSSAIILTFDLSFARSFNLGDALRAKARTRQSSRLLYCRTNSRPRPRFVPVTMSMLTGWEFVFCPLPSTHLLLWSAFLQAER